MDNQDVQALAGVVDSLKERTVSVSLRIVAPTPMGNALVPAPQEIQGECLGTRQDGRIIVIKSMAQRQSAGARVQAPPAEVSATFHVLTADVYSVVEIGQVAAAGSKLHLAH